MGYPYSYTPDFAMLRGMPNSSAYIDNSPKFGLQLLIIKLSSYYKRCLVIAIPARENIYSMISIAAIFPIITVQYDPEGNPLTFYNTLPSGSQIFDSIQLNLYHLKALLYSSDFLFESWWIFCNFSIHIYEKLIFSSNILNAHSMISAPRFRSNLSKSSVVLKYSSPRLSCASALIFFKQSYPKRNGASLCSAILIWIFRRKCYSPRIVSKVAIATGRVLG